MFYHGKLLNGNNVLKNEFRPAYLNGSNTEKLPVKRFENFQDDGSDVGESHITSTTTTTSVPSTSVPSSSSGNVISSFQETLNRMKNAANNKNLKDLESQNKIEKMEIKHFEREKKFLSVTMKPFLFFDLLTSKDSSRQSRELSQSLSNIGTIYLIIHVLS